mmetsp:Transcript_10461/g.11589  ORF Transcript_10461/g.11589 Transcript_10461/m.11589 type:complete len:83 (-) Transcript_10461:223-471(-)
MDRCYGWRCKREIKKEKGRRECVREQKKDQELLRKVPWHGRGICVERERERSKGQQGRNVKEVSHQIQLYIRNEMTKMIHFR